MDTCPICEEPVSPKIGDYGEKIFVNCAICGMFGISRTALTNFKNGVARKPALRFLLSHYIRETLNRDNSKSQDTPVLNSGTLSALLDFYKPATLREQANNLLRWLGDKLRDSDPGAQLPLKPKECAAIMGAASVSGMNTVVEHLLDRGLVRGVMSGEAPGNLGLSFGGWDAYDELQRAHSEGPIAFMAMQFGDAQLDAIYREHLRPAVAQCGFELRRLDENAPAGLIDNRLRVEIRRSRFVIVDLTHDNRGAYWEAGFAEGLGKPVIYTCEGTHFAAKGVHFDTNHHQTIVWQVADFGSAAARLKDTIRATLPSEAKMNDD